ncbi:YiiX/YebB-like N1pC/P60 family cysteine hydrolase, partial [Bacteriovoracaceae bacterium]|nr:YiiX/YebB-like N1pC/P60 family cysteine hydrolase [Bacteriovoracaceae bacterium]
CGVIEDETNSEFSHLGIILKTNKGTMVLDSAGKVMQSSLKSFVSKAKKYSFLKLIRSNQSEFFPDSFTMNLIFRLEFEGAPYDPYFLVNNVINSKSALYCSEFVKEYFDLLGIETPDYRPMEFNKNLEKWKTYYLGLNIKVPEGELGINPESFNQSNLYESIKSFYKSY